MSAPLSDRPAGGALRIREAGPCDVAVLAELNSRCFLAGGDEAFAGTPWTARSMAEVLALPGAFGLLAVLEDAPIGFVLAQALFEDAEILSLGVLAGHRRAGHGRRLLRAAVAVAAGRGARRLQLEVAASNAAAQAFYGAEGFAPVGRRRNYYRLADSSVLDAILLARPLEGPEGPAV
ncbi:MAG: GNAT family N-acetyltransferase [Kiloniellaceae bacterium]|nr:GNAT family N-acetyltransferase [Kiloniellaceae bacterium]